MTSCLKGASELVVGNGGGEIGGLTQFDQALKELIDGDLITAPELTKGCDADLALLCLVVRDALLDADLGEVGRDILCRVALLSHAADELGLVDDAGEEPGLQVGAGG